MCDNSEGRQVSDLPGDCVLAEGERMKNGHGTITVMSFNTQHCRNYISGLIDYDAVVEEIRRIGADIVGLNEIRGKGRSADYEAQTEILAEKLGFHSYFAKALDVDGINPYGNAILSRFPIRRAWTVAIPDPKERVFDRALYESRCLLKADIDVGDGLTVCVVHFGLNPDEQDLAVNTVIEQIRPEKCILMGDFNMTPEQKRLKPIHEKMFDTASLFGGERFSYPADKPDMRIDYLYTSRELEVLSADILADVVSDHRPYVAQIRI